MNSLERRLQMGLTLSLMLLMALLWWAGSYAVEKLSEDLIVSRLEHDAESLLAAVDFTPGEGPQLALRRVNPIYQQPFSGHYYVIRLADDNQWYSRSLWDQDLSVPSLQAGETLQWYTSGPSGQQLLMWARRFQKQGHDFVVAVGEDLTPVGRHMTLFQWTFAGLSVLALAMLLLIQQQVLHRSFRRLEGLRTDIQRLEEGRIDALPEDVPTEILPLVHEFNRLLGLLGQRLERSRNAMGNLAHALKTPLNLLVQYLDSRELNGHVELRAHAQLQTERIRQLMDRELKRARVAGEGSPGQRFNPQQEMPDLVGVLKQVYQRRDIEVQWQVAEGVNPFGDREDMLELIGNLLDNACKWAVSRVCCNIEGMDPIIIRVADDGSGLDNEQLEQLAQRGVRLDESVEGHGLGLAIAKDIVKLYGGEMSFGRSAQWGGLEVEIVLPQGRTATQAP